MSVFDTAPTLGRVLMYHHADEGKDYPGMVCDVRGRDGHGMYVKATTSEDAIRFIEEEGGPITIQVNLAILRPGKLEWKWCAQNDDPASEGYWGGWSWPTRQAPPSTP